MTTASENLCIPIIPLKNTTLFPQLFLPIVVNRPLSIKAIEEALASEDKIIGVFVQKDASIEKPGINDLYNTGTLAVIKKMLHLNKLVHIMVQGIERIELIDVAKKENYYNVHKLPQPSDTNAEIEAIHRAILDLAAKMAKLVQPEIQVDVNYIISEINKPLDQAYLISTLLSLSVEKEIKILQANTQIKVFHLVHDYLMHEIQVLQLRNRITNQAKSEMSKQQLRADLIPKIEACRLATGPHMRHRKASSATAPTTSTDDPIQRMKAAVGSICEKPVIVGIGISTGGPAALTKMLPQLPASFPCPIVLVQHRSEEHTSELQSH